MKIVNIIAKCVHYIFRLFLAYVYIPHGYEKLTTTINPQEYIDYGLGNEFLEFYLIWEKTNFIWVIGFFQLLGGLLLLSKKTTFFGSILLMPISLGMFFCHYFISHAADFLLFDAIVLALNVYLIVENFELVKSIVFQKNKSWI